MLAKSDCEIRLLDLQGQLGRAHAVTADLMSKVAGTRTRFTMPRCAGKAAKIDRLIESEAWTEAALALVEVELPQWRLHRLVYEQDAWLCSLNKQWNLRVWLSDCAEARHQSLPLAILSALIEARQCSEPPSEPLSSRTASSVRNAGAKQVSPLKPCAATILPEPPGSLGMAISHSVEVLPCLSAEPTARPAGGQGLQKTSRLSSSVDRNSGGHRVQLRGDDGAGLVRRFHWRGGAALGRAEV
jgi:hypothetical protein